MVGKANGLRIHYIRMLNMYLSQRQARRINPFSLIILSSQPMSQPNPCSRSVWLYSARQLTCYESRFTTSTVLFHLVIDSFFWKYYQMNNLVSPKGSLESGNNIFCSFFIFLIAHGLGFIFLLLLSSDCFLVLYFSFLLFN